MAVALLPSEKDSYFASSLRRSHSQPKLSTQSCSRSPSRSKSSTNFAALIPPSGSVTSSGESSPRTIHADSPVPSYTSTPASSLSLDHREDEDNISFPTYDEAEYFGPVEDLEPPASPQTGDSYTVSPLATNTDSTDDSRPHSPTITEHAEDDSAVRKLPSRHVDYLSHNWREEDIWSSWQLIVSKRKAYNNSARLENASWRTWMKAKFKLKTVTPETLNWYVQACRLLYKQLLMPPRLKDCDVTWLYGPLQTGSDKAFRLPSPSSSPLGSSRISKSNSFLHKKPILKKRSMSEIMLQKSLSSSSLLKQAAAAVQAQQSQGLRPNIGRATSDFPTLYSRRFSQGNHPGMLSSVTSSALESPYPGERKHIHFNESVEQCIAIDMKGDDDEPDNHAVSDDSDSDDDGGLLMKRSNSSRKLPPLRRSSTPKQSFNADSKTIAKLPSTTLKYRENTPEPQETAMKHSSGFWNGKSKLLSPSPSQETLRPSKPSTRILVGEDEDDEDMDWQPSSSFGNRKDGIVINQDRYNSLHPSGSSSSLNGEPSSGMRRTPSGMFMPYEEDEDTVVSEGLFGKVVDTVNTAKDIAHVIWNVGWRR
jgi:hypothetical protein